MNKRNKKRAFIAIVLVLFLTSLFNQAFGQEIKNGSPEKNSDLPSQLIATVSAQNIVFQEEGDGKFLITFDVKNELMVQPEVRYGVVLKKIENGKETEVDRKIADGFFTLFENHKISKKIEYQAPFFSQGRHELFLEVRTADGLLLDYAKVGQLDLSGSNQYLEIEKERCSLINFSNNKEAWFKEGLHYAENDSVFLRCPATNKFDQEIKVLPTVVLNSNSPFGEILSETEYQAIAFNSKEEKNVELKIPFFRSEFNNAASLNIFFKKDDQIASPKIETNLFFYSKSQENAWLINARFEKESYASGDTAKAVINWDGFLSNQNGSDISIKEIPAKIELISQNGISCQKSSEIESLSQRNGRYESKISIPVDRDCKNFMLRVALFDSRGETLAIEEYKVVPQKIQAKIIDKLKKIVVKYKKEIIITFAVFNLLIIFWFIFRWIRKKITYRNYIIPVLPLVLAIFIGTPGKICASTYYDPEDRLIYNFSTDKESYFVNNETDRKYTLRSSVQRCYYKSGNLLTQEFHLALQIRSPGLKTEKNISDWISVLENASLNYNQIIGVETEAETPRIQDYDPQTGPYLRALLNGSFISQGEPLAKLDLKLQEDGKCGKLNFINERPDQKEACLYGVSGFSDDQKKLEYADMNGKIRWKCLNIEGNQDESCEGSITIDAQCGKANNKGICDIGKYVSSAQSIFSDYPLYCDNLDWIIGQQKNLAIWGKVPENFISDSNEKEKKWICKGINGGVDANCRMAPGKKAVCGSASNQPAKDIPREGLCASGSPSGVIRIQELQSGANSKKIDKWKWSCDFSEMNISYGCTVECSAPVLVEEKTTEQIPENKAP